MFVGENNSGKSTVLDAIYWGIKGLEDIGVLREILEARVRRSVERSEIFFGYLDMPGSKFKVSMEFKEENYTIEIEVLKEGRQLNTLDGAVYGLLENYQTWSVSL